jgi:Holliday junction DNA helicase RuvA
MITSLSGTLTELSPTNVTVQIGGIGYEISIPLSSFDKLPKVGCECKLLTYLHVREDILQLYGFITHEERDLFKLLLTVSGIGPKTALSILSKITVTNLKGAIASGNTELLSDTPGIGKKTAQRVVMELKEKMGGFGIKTSKPLPKGEEYVINDAVRALVNLGYKQIPAQGAIEKAFAETDGEVKLEELLKKALKYL